MAGGIQLGEGVAHKGDGKEKTQEGQRPGSSDFSIRCFYLQFLLLLLPLQLLLLVVVVV